MSRSRTTAQPSLQDEDIDPSQPDLAEPIPFEPSSSGSRRVRGPSKGILRPSRLEDRQVIEITKAGNFIGGDFKKTVASQVKGRLKKPYIRWSQWNDEDKDTLWNSISECFQFSKSEEVARKTLYKYMSKNYSSWMRTARIESLDKAEGRKDGDMTEKCKEFPPEWLLPSVWGEMVDFFLCEQWKLNAHRNKRNRLSNEDTLIYTGGSMTFDEHVQKGKGKGLDEIDVYSKTRQKKDLVTPPPIVQTRVESYRALIPLTHSTDGSITSSAPFDPCVSVSVSGGVKKGLLAGFGSSKTAKELFMDYNAGSTASSSTASIGCQPTHPTSSTAPEIQKIREQQVELGTQVGKLQTMIKDVFGQLSSLADLIRSTQQPPGESSSSQAP